MKEYNGMPGRNHSRDFKLSVCRQIAGSEKRPAQVCREHGLAESLLLRWRKEYRERGEAAFGPHQAGEPDALAQKVAELERFCGQLALENAVLKKALARTTSRSVTP
jgi:transposase